MRKYLALLLLPTVFAGCATTHQYKQGLAKCGSSQCYTAPVSQHGSYYTTGMDMYFKVPGEYLQGDSKITLAVETTFSAVSPSPNLINDHTLDVNSVRMLRNEANYYMDTNISALLDSNPRDRVRLINDGVKNNLLTNFAIKGVKNVEL